MHSPPYPHRPFPPRSGGLLLLLWLLLIAPALAVADISGTPAQALAEGDYPGAIALARQLLHDAPPAQRIQALLWRGEAHRALGYLGKARADFEQALREAQPEETATQQLAARLALGLVLLQQQEFAAANALLHSVREQAPALRLARLEAAALLGLAELQLIEADREAARALLQQALEAARSGSDGAQIATVLLQLATLEPDAESAQALLRAAEQASAEVTAPYPRANLLLGIAEQRVQRHPAHPPAEVRQLLHQALSLARALDAPRLLSAGYGQLATLYAQQGRIHEARTLTEWAIFQAQRDHAQELLLRWEGQLGQLLRTQGETTAAIAAYRRAVYHIESIRHDIPITYRGGRSSFRDTLEPIYLALADLLLAQSALEPRGSASEQALLREAQETVEQIKVSELRDYFQDPCITARSETLHTLAPHTAVLYPIILPDRLELLLGIDDQLHRRSVAIQAEALVHTTARLVRTLRPTSVEWLPPFDRGRAKRLHDWLIRPIEEILQQHAIETLVFVPDGVLRLLPIAVLWDGEHFLAERYAIATAPGLTLLDPKPLPREQTQVLLAGLSRPGPVVRELPPTLWQLLALATPPPADAVRLRGIPVESGTLRGPASPIQPPDEALFSRLQDALALPGVIREIEQLEAWSGGRVLMDQGFHLQHFSSELGKTPYQIVHIASHGFFGGSPEENFIMTYDRKLDMDQLAALIQPRRLTDQPVELLTLSACQTAQGDDRSPLGLSGIAIKSGARSALGALWPVADDATQQLLPAFYQALADPAHSKAGALRQAQRALLAQEGYQHPFYWSAFILIGNWL